MAQTSFAVDLGQELRGVGADLIPRARPAERFGQELPAQSDGDGAGRKPIAGCGRGNPASRDHLQSWERPEQGLQVPDPNRGSREQLDDGCPRPQGGGHFRRGHDSRHGKQSCGEHAHEQPLVEVRADEKVGSGLCSGTHLFRCRDRPGTEQELVAKPSSDLS